MGITKTDLYTAKQNELATIYKCLGHPARIAILEYLAAKKSCINTSLVNEIGLAQPTISQHLTALKELGLIKGTIEGKAMNYCINQEKWNDIKNETDRFFHRVAINDGDCC